MSQPNSLRRRLSLAAVSLPLLPGLQGCAPPLRRVVHASSTADARTLVMELNGVERVSMGGRRHDCDMLRIRVEPGLGFSRADELALSIDVEDRLMRRARFTRNGLESTRGAIAEVDLSDHVVRNGVTWPTRFYERLLRPLPVHNWTLAGLDCNRGLTRAEIDGAGFSGRAAQPAAALG